jgi:hypothetical protein
MYKVRCVSGVLETNGDKFFTKKETECVKCINVLAIVALYVMLRAFEFTK